MTYRRVLLYGVTGSGKSTAAARLSEATGIPWHSVDDLTWQPGWVALPDDEQRAVFRDICAGERWILDSAYRAWLDVALARADLVVGLDYPRWLSFARLVRRTVRRAVRQEVVCNGNRERWRAILSRDSILIWHARSFARKRGRMRAALGDADGPEVLLFRRPRDLERWLGQQPSTTY
ncbi:adenylate kinase [Nocardioides dongxiaopingii]|uniref:adenylate kinase n=1 Tax=Nocardioides dongxiaopingii TaxID=2576036 RepID=UPI0010C76B12|nr:adenylate kinase [Nocardioides dongxiaopingii]